MARQNNLKKVNDFRFSLIDNSSHKQLWSIRFSRPSFIIVSVSAILIVIALVYSLIAFTPLRVTIPGYPDAHSRRTAIQNAIKIDSLEKIITRWEIYSENLSRIVNGQEPLQLDSILKARNNRDFGNIDKEELSKQDSLLRQTVTEAEKFNIDATKERNLPIEGMHFFVPLKGVVSQGYERVSHPYIDITAPAGSVVMSVLEGTVIFAGWNDEAGYTIRIQHSNDIVSIYKHNQKLLKNTGDKVSAGTSIALVGNTGALTTGDHLHFELWYKGEAIDPTQYISF